MHGEMVQRLIHPYKTLGANMSIKLNNLHSHVYRFQENLGSTSNEQGERFHQDIKEMECRYQGRWDKFMMVDYCWSLERDDPGAKNSQAAKKRKFLR